MAVHTTKRPRPTDLTRDVGAMIRAARERRRITQSQLADRTGKSLQMIGRIERGLAAPSFETLESLAAELDVSVASFFQVGGYEAGATESAMSRIVDWLSRLDADDLEWVEELLKVAVRRKVRAS